MFWHSGGDILIMSVGSYIHVPFCRARCHFCAFYLLIYRTNHAHAYLNALSQEIRLHAAQNSLEGRPLDTVYFGGGTPTTLKPAHLSMILESVRDHFGLSEQAEITLEAHPDTVTVEGLVDLRQAGFNRISLGVETMDGKELIRIGRWTLPARVRTAVGEARTAGFENINLDLIYGLPGQELSSWRATLEATIALNPTHISCYALTVEEGTRLERGLHLGEWAEADSTLQFAMEKEATRQLATAGFQHYEISNFCRPGFACRHNLLYWTGGDYLGLGPSAQSYLNGRRFGNIGNLEGYQTTLGAGRLPVAQIDHLSPEQRWRETIVFGLRLTEGIDPEAMGLHAQADDPGWYEELKRMIGEGFVEQRTGRIRLTEMGRRFADSVAVALL